MDMNLFVSTARWGVAACTFAVLIFNAMIICLATFAGVCIERRQWSTALVFLVLASLSAVMAGIMTITRHGYLRDAAAIERMVNRMGAQSR